MKDIQKNAIKYIEQVIKLEPRERLVKWYLDSIAKYVPTMIFIGRTEDDIIALYMHSPEDDDDEQLIDYCFTVVVSMIEDSDIRSILHKSFIYYFSKNVEKWEEIKTAWNNGTIGDWFSEQFTGLGAKLGEIGRAHV